MNIKKFICSKPILILLVITFTLLLVYFLKEPFESYLINVFIGFSGANYFKSEKKHPKIRIIIAVNLFVLLLATLFFTSAKPIEYVTFLGLIALGIIIYLIIDKIKKHIVTKKTS